jgi:hypothetical protein
LARWAIRPLYTKIPKILGIYKPRMEIRPDVTLYKYDIKKEKDNTCNKDVDSVDKKVRNKEGYCGREHCLPEDHYWMLVIC